MSTNLTGNKDKFRPTALALCAGALVALLLTNIAQPVDWSESWASTLLFLVVLVLTNDLAPPPATSYDNMVHIVMLAALLATGLTPALWVAVLGTVLAEYLRQLLAPRITLVHRPSQRTWLSIATNTGVNGVSLCIAGWVYQEVLRAAGLVDPGVGTSAVVAVWTGRGLLAMVPLFGSYFLVHNALCAWLLQARGESFADYFYLHLPRILALQLLPLALAAILAQVYLEVGALFFLVFYGTLIGLWTLARRLGEAHRDREKRLRKLRTLNEMGQSIATSLELDVLLSTLYHQVNQLMEADNFYIALYDAVTDELNFPVVFEDGERKRYSGRRAGNGLTEFVIRQRKPLLIREHAVQLIDRLGLEMMGQPALSWLGVPLVSSDKVLGVITVQSFIRTHAYDEEDMAFLSTLAAQAAIALENAQLYGQMRRRAAELALLNTVSTAVSSTLDLNQVLQIVVTAIMPIMVCQKSALYLLDDADGKLHLSAAQGFSDEFKPSLIWQDDLRLQQARDQNIVIVPDVTTSGRSAAEIEMALREGCRALVEVSLVAQNELVGVLGIYYDQTHHFDLAERDLLTTFANQAATAIANARLYSHADQARARRVGELLAIERIGRELISMLEPQRVLDLVLEQAMDATNASQGCIAMLDSAQRLVNVVAQRGYTAEIVEEFFDTLRPLDEGVVGHVLRHGQLALVRDVQQEPTYVALEPAVRSQLTVPILREGVVLGAINLESTQVNDFDEQDASFVSQLATQTAVALANAQLFQDRSQRVEELSLLYQASLALASSLEYQDVLEIVSRLALHITNSHAVTLYLFDAGKDKFERVSSQGYHAGETRPSTIRRKGVTRTIIETGQPMLIPDTLEYADINPLVVKRGIRSVIGVPVMSRAAVWGALYVNHRQPYAYTENDVRLVAALANQAGATIANVDLFRQVSEARDRLEAIINSTQEGILVLDNFGRVVIASAHLESFSDLRREQLVGCTVDELLQNHQGELQRLLGLTPDELGEWEALLQTNSTESSRRTYQIPGAGSTVTPPRPRFAELFSTPVLDEASQVIGRLLVFRDITEEKELEEMREDLTGMIIHDLRSPLTAVLSGLEMIKDVAFDENSDPLAIEAMQVAGRGCQSMLTLVNSLLDISRLESGQMPLERAPAPLAPLARSVVSRMSPLAVERDVVVHTDLAPDLPMVEIDNEKIGRVLTNLLDNALKFVPAGGRITLRAVHQNDELGNVLLCSVSDDGPGIPKEFQEKIFDRFAQVRHQAVPQRLRGTGLGLAFCKLAIEAHGGRIWVESDSGQGSTFYFTLPVADIAAWLGE